MDFEITSDQTMLKNSVAEFLKKEAPYDTIKEINESDNGYSSAMWKKMAKLDWLGIPFPEEYEGLQEPLMSLCLVMEELGRFGCPSPYFTTVVLSGMTILASGNADQKKEIIQKIISGKLLVTIAMYEDSIGYDFTDTIVKAKKTEDGYTLAGNNILAHDANIADLIIVTAQTEKGNTLFIINSKATGVEIKKIPSLGSDNLCAINLNNVNAKDKDRLGEFGHANKILNDVMNKALVAKSAEMLGGCKAAIDLAAKYSCGRIQYDVPIGGQQAIQHRLADMKTAYDTCLHYYYKVIWMIEEGMDFATDAFALKAKLNEVYNFIGYHAVRIHGGVGLTDEFSVSLYFRKAKAAEFVLGDSSNLYEKVAQKLLD